MLGNHAAAVSLADGMFSSRNAIETAASLARVRLTMSEGEPCQRTRHLAGHLPFGTMLMTPFLR